MQSEATQRSFLTRFVSSPLLSEWWQQNWIWAFQSAKDDVRTHKHARIYTHTHTPTCMFTHTHACSHTHTCSLTHTHVCTPTLSLSHTHTHTCMLTHTHAHTHMHTHTHANTHKHARSQTHTHTHTNTHTPEKGSSRSFAKLCTSQAPKQKLHPRCQPHSQGVTSLDENSPPVDVSMSGISVMRAFAFLRPFFLRAEEKFTVTSSAVGCWSPQFWIVSDVPSVWSAVRRGSLRWVMYWRWFSAALEFWKQPKDSCVCHL